MTETVQTALIVSAAPTIIAMASLIASLRNGKKADAIKVEIDGKFKQWLKETRASGFQQGMAHEKRQDAELKAEAAVLKRTQAIKLPTPLDE